MSDALVIGLDIGGTSTRALVATLAGDRVGTGTAGGGNPTSHGAEAAAAELGKALSEALAATDPTRVRAGVIGIAGVARLLADPASRAAFERTWADAGLRCPYEMIGDALVAYASGTASPDGSVLISGTGAIAVTIRGFALDRVSDGHGWLLGDAGSGFWLGREAVRATLAAMDAGRPLGRLSRAVVTTLLHAETSATSVGRGDLGALSARDQVDVLVQRVTRRPAVELAKLAPLVIAAQADGDPTANALVAEAARLLTDSVARIRDPGDPSPIVLAGGLLVGQTPLAAAVERELSARWPDAPRPHASDGAAAAAWLAARPQLTPTEAAALHTRLFP
ncbi:BadF/BadG/BcrA/BcrD ATPase family protein [Phytohabitans sp. ZYX-F-186]|uniref:BadF/BadG/BcrA/BcrD ATPase family protein n=1 Tax=Phytohabitans maris TaxID=3071409 RepID=A0ABU0ZBA1_9ACTN|nr:BadF/BadG/BcrA/BcrD ATPase family protein [Phytohabitans sp. ZYX-F-186]MDQ7904318.1 BadF/BadG/BcrA/BcrD ATPase family protein [Phytohabitans sp. ZYX-F-186]